MDQNETYVEFHQISENIIAPSVTLAEDESSQLKKVTSWFATHFTSNNTEVSPDKRINVVARKSPISKDSENRNYWMSDEAVKNCYNCDKEFSLTRRKHHCRFCGQIFCWKCCPLRTFPISVRSCQKCLGMRRKSTLNLSPSVNSPAKNVFMSECINVNDNIDLNLILEEFESGSLLNQAPSLMSTFRNTRQENGKHEYQGENIMKWLERNDYKPECAQQMLDKKLLESLDNCSVFDIEGFYRRHNPPEYFNLENSTSDSHDSHPYEIIDRLETNEGLQDLLECALKDDSLVAYETIDIPDTCLNCINPLFGEVVWNARLRTKPVIDVDLQTLYDDYLDNLESIILKKEKLEWNLGVSVRELCDSISQNTLKDCFDPRQLVHFKKNICPSENSVKVELLEGVALSGKIFYGNNFLNENLKVLLMNFPLNFRHEQNRLHSMDDLLLQEQEWLSHCCARILDRKPDIIFMSKSISYFAKMLFMKTESLILVTNVKETAMKRLSKATMAEIVKNMEVLKTAKLGIAPYVKTEVIVGNEAMILVGSLLKGTQFSVLISGHTIDYMQYIQYAFLHLLLLYHQSKCELIYLQTLLSDTKTFNENEETTDCKCNHITNNYTKRYFAKPSLEEKYDKKTSIPSQKTNDFLSPVINNHPVRIESQHYMECFSKFIRIQEAENDGLYTTATYKRHRFHIPDAVGIEKHPYTTPNIVLDGKENAALLANFRACGSYPLENPGTDITETGEVLLPNFNQFDNVLEYAISYSSYCLERFDQLLCILPTIISLTPYSMQDISIKQFISQLSHPSLCSHCSLPNNLHVRRMVYGNRALHVILYPLKNRITKDSFLFWVDGTHPEKMDETSSSMSIASFIKLLLSPKEPKFDELITKNHYFALGNMLCCLKPYDLESYSLCLPSINKIRTEKIWNSKSYTDELNILSKEGFDQLDEIKRQIDNVSVDFTQKEELSIFYEHQRDNFRFQMDQALSKYSKMLADCKWSEICQAYFDICKLGLTIVQIREGWKASLSLALNKKEHELDYSLPEETALPDVLSNPISFIQSLSNMRNMSDKKNHFFSNSGNTEYSEIMFPIREEEPTSSYAFALLNDTDLTCDDENPSIKLLSVQNNDISLQCKLYHHSKFHMLRESLGEDKLDYIQSLMRCETWDAKGGKSGARFYKSYDHRFVVKNIGPKEVKTVTEIGGLYVDYMLDNAKYSRPSCLGKIYGAFQLTVKSKDNKSQLDYVIMEDIFYENEVLVKYDLKGSQRNRMSKEENVFLDSNFINHMRDDPIYITKASHMILTSAVVNDSTFLSNHMIIDYSLLVGVDKKEKKITVGMIDFIRTFTWDKKMEYEIKTHFTPGSTPPTILHPIKYKERFIESIAKYFNYSPSRNDEGLQLKDTCGSVQ